MKCKPGFAFLVAELSPLGIAIDPIRQCISASFGFCVRSTMSPHTSCSILRKQLCCVFVDGNGSLKKTILWWAFWVTVINAFLYNVVRNAMPLLERTSGLSARDHGRVIGNAVAETMITPPPPGAIPETIGAVSLPWILVGLFCLIEKFIRKGSFRVQMLQASPFVLVLALLITVSISRPFWNPS